MAKLTEEELNKMLNKNVSLHFKAGGYRKYGSCTGKLIDYGRVLLHPKLHYLKFETLNSQTKNEFFRNVTFYDIDIEKHLQMTLLE